MKVSVLLITYNHERFITRAIDSILGQKAEFEYEIVIGEDCSTDRTREIVIDFKKRFPDKIRLLLNKKNVGGRKNFVQMLNASRGDYIALLEGDDYWTSPHKLQKQVNFLDSHPGCALCFHSVEVLWDDQRREPKVISPPNQKEIYGLRDLLEWTPFTCSTMFRKGLFGEFPPWFYTSPSGDWPLLILNAEHGEMGYINEVMGVYRIHSGGAWSSKASIQRFQAVIEMYRTINAHLNYRYNKVVRSRISLNYYQMAEEYRNNGDRIKALKNLFKCIITSPVNQPIPLPRLFLKMAAWGTPEPFRRSVRLLMTKLKADKA